MFGDKDPSDDFDRIVRRMLENMPNFSVRGGRGARNTMNTYVDQSVDAKRGQLSVVMDLPGVKKEDIKANVREKGNRLWLMVEARSINGDINRSFRQQISLKRRVDPELADTEYNNGVLTIEFPLVNDKDGRGTDIEI